MTCLGLRGASGETRILNLNFTRVLRYQLRHTGKDKAQAKETANLHKGCCVRLSHFTVWRPALRSLLAYSAEARASLFFSLRASRARAPSSSS